MIFVSCSWCHTENPVGARFCSSCGHRAGKPRIECDCPACQGLTVVGMMAVQVFEWTDAESGFTYFWNATLGRLLAEERGDIVSVSLPDAGMDTMEAVLSICPEMDTQEALALPLEALLVPILFVTNQDRHVLIDGRHRLYKAVTLGLEVLPAYVLSEEESATILAGKFPPKKKR